MLVAALLAAAAPGCREDAPPLSAAPAASQTATALAAPSAAAVALALHADGPPGDPERGRALVVRFECNRCHDGTGLDAAPQQKHCVHCHQDILGGKFSAPAATLARWKDHLGYLREVPSLASMGKRYKREWISHFLLEPYDLRPRLPATMPRLAITEAEARDVAAYLTRDAISAPAPVSLEGANAAHGRELVDAKGCGACHQFTGVAPLEGASTLKPGEQETRSAVALAPDLRYARDFMGPAQLVTWIMDPLSIKKDTLMAQVPMTPEEARDIAAYVLTTELAPAVPKPIPARLPVLARRVSYDEVMEKVLHRTCRHCHSEPDYALGEGGPGNTGGFGFAPRGFNVGNHEGMLAGYLDDHGDRHSVFSPMPDGTPRLVAALLARQEEEAGRPRADLRGMPLGLPALTPEEVQLVESWVAQGRPE